MPPLPFRSRPIGGLMPGVSDALATRVEDLGVSVRTSELLNALGVETIADLLALPSINAKPVVVAELTELLAEMELVYEGDWVTPELPDVLQTTGSDLAPAANGAIGQIFTLYVDDDTRAVVATNCAELLSRLFRELQDGTIDLE